MANNSRFVRVAFIISIIVVLNLFFNYSIYLVYPSPQYETYCPQTQVVPPYTDQASCTAAGGQWSPEQMAPGSTQPSGYCNPTYTCSNNFDHANTTYARNVFIALIILGIVSLGVSVLFATAPVVSAGLSWGGVLSLIIASARYWSYAQTSLQVVILGIALVALLWFGARRFR